MKFAKPEVLHKRGASIKELDAFAKAITDFTQQQSPAAIASSDSAPAEKKGKSRSKKKEETEE